MASYLGREVRITYGTLVIGATEDLQPTGQVEITKADNSFLVTFSFVYSVAGLADPGAAFEAKLAEIDAALRDREQALEIVYGPLLDRNLLTFPVPATDTQDTALNLRCEWSRGNYNVTTNRSVRYDVRISGGLPPSDAARAGRREFDQNVVYDSSRRLNVIFSGEWTRVGSTGASAGYLAGIAGLVTPYLSTNFPGRVFEKVEEDYQPDESDDVCTYRVVYREILVAQTGAGTGLLDDPDFVDQTLVITRSRREGAGPFGDAEPLVALTAILTTKVDREQNSLGNVGIPNLDGLVENKILPAVVEALQEAVGGQSVAVVSVAPDFDPTSNQLRVAVEAVSRPGGNLLERTLVTQDNSQSNTVLRKAYQDGTERDQPVPSDGANLFGQPLVKVPRAWTFTTAGTVVRRITDQRTLLGGSRFINGAAGAGAQNNVSPAGAGARGTSGGTRERGSLQQSGENDPVTAVVVGRQFGIQPGVRGIRGIGVTIPVVEVISIIELELYDPITGSAGGGSGSSAGGTRTRGSAGSEG